MDARVQYEPVEPSETRPRGVDPGGFAFRVGGVEPAVQHVVRGRQGAGGRVPEPEAEVPAGGVHLGGDGGADAAAGTGDHDDKAVHAGMPVACCAISSDHSGPGTWTLWPGETSRHSRLGGT